MIKVYMNVKTGRIFHGVYYSYPSPTKFFLIGKNNRKRYINDNWLSGFEFIGEL